MLRAALTAAVAPPPGAGAEAGVAPEPELVEFELGELDWVGLLDVDGLELDPELLLEELELPWRDSSMFTCEVIATCEARPLESVSASLFSTAR